ncbi:TPA: glycosyltransferase [Vibrio parahaemolyticus]|uniref:glycosyltransferase n=1 Tax=Vibrio parahaemolyticus TaxID=670 RepID=UPI001E5B35B5|nr:glycosyltransferase [Vibrio parahaemolyticus]HCG7972808.1 glycosyltransferase [Vibrio parahaemolyticus]HDM8217029.1 glycosyltransferase [Vibrio campbellii]
MHISHELVSVYIPTKNRLSLLKRAIESVKEQTYSRVELIIVDDGSTDGTIEYLNQIKSDSIKFILNNTSKGAPYCRNLAIKLAKGRYITGLDDDDWFTNDRLEIFVKSWNDKYSFICSNSMYPYDKESFTHRFKKIINDFTKNKTYGIQDFFRINHAGNQIFTLRERMLNELFDESLPALQDYELWLRMLEKYGTCLKLKNKLQYIDDSHEFQRITSLERRIEALKIIQMKHMYSREQFKYLIASWRWEFGLPTSIVEKYYILRVGLAKEVIKRRIERIIKRF